MGILIEARQGKQWEFPNLAIQIIGYVLVGLGAGVYSDKATFLPIYFIPDTNSKQWIIEIRFKRYSFPLSKKSNISLTYWRWAWESSLSLCGICLDILSENQKQQTSKGSNKDGLCCTYCEKPRHTKETSFKMQGKEWVLSRMEALKDKGARLASPTKMELPKRLRLLMVMNSKTWIRKKSKGCEVHPKLFPNLLVLAH